MRFKERRLASSTISCPESTCRQTRKQFDRSLFILISKDLFSCNSSSKPRSMEKSHQSTSASSSKIQTPEEKQLPPTPGNDDALGPLNICRLQRSSTYRQAPPSDPSTLASPSLVSVDYVEDNAKDDDGVDEVWHVGHSTTDRSFVKYIVLVLLGFTIVLFSIVQIVRNPADNNTTYFTMMMTTFAVFAPNPTFGAPRVQGSLRGRDTHPLMRKKKKLGKNSVRRPVNSTASPPSPFALAS